jgi:DNA repair exonuclease SbcCD ATPase subunit
MTDTLTYSGQLLVLTCWCGMRHAVPKELREFQERQHRNGIDPIGIYCPLGHSHVPAGEGEAERLRRELEEQRERARRARETAAAERDLRADTERRLAAQKGATTRARKRAAAALCPCCNRSFVQLRRHLAAKHPDYVPDAVP